MRFNCKQINIIIGIGIFQNAFNDNHINNNKHSIRCEGISLY